MKTGKKNTLLVPLLTRPEYVSHPLLTRVHGTSSHPLRGCLFVHLMKLIKVGLLPKNQFIYSQKVKRRIEGDRSKQMRSRMKACQHHWLDPRAEFILPINGIIIEIHILMVIHSFPMNLNSGFVKIRE